MPSWFTNRHLRFRQNSHPCGWGTGLLILFAGVPLLLSACSRDKYTETKCPSSDPKIIALYKADNGLNRAIVYNDWKTIYGLFELGYRAGVAPEPDHESFRLQAEEADSFGAVITVRMISHDIRGDTAIVSNYVSISASDSTVADTLNLEL